MSIERNANNEQLCAMERRRCSRRGRRAQKVTEEPPYVPTRHELQVLTRHWAGPVIKARHATPEKIRPAESRLVQFADRRLALLTECLGQDTVCEIYLDVAHERENSGAKRLTTPRHANGERKAARVVRNADNEHLLPAATGPWALGCVDEVNGEGAEEVRSYVPTRHELRVLLRHWAEIAESLEFFMALYEAGSTEVRLRPFAYLRISRIGQYLGDDSVRAVNVEVEQKFATAITTAWIARYEGDREEQDRFRLMIVGAVLAKRR
jgi:hypothetical protein